MKQQAAAIPFRRAGKKLEVCIIRRKGAKRKWGIPKGFIDRGDTAKETALKEASEEAGLTGKVIGDPIGTYEYEKWGTKLEVSVFLMEVKGEDEDWDEADFRERKWVPFDEAADLLDEHPVEPLLQRAKNKLA